MRYSSTVVQSIASIHLGLRYYLGSFITPLNLKIFTPYKVHHVKSDDVYCCAIWLFTIFNIDAHLLSLIS